ncbi:MAG: tripartite tricarboxylate transporter substrate-binding protein [Xanthobacteraceae bacterium]
MPFRGAPEAMQALLENQVQLYLAGWVVGRSYVESGAIRALAVAAAQQIPNIPVPTSAEGGMPQYIASNWWGLAAPKGTPPAVINQVYLAAKAALADPKARGLLEKAGYLIVGDTPQEFARDAKSEAKTWAQTVERGKLAVR